MSIRSSSLKKSRRKSLELNCIGQAHVELPGRAMPGNSCQIKLIHLLSLFVPIEKLQDHLPGSFPFDQHCLSVSIITPDCRCQLCDHFWSRTERHSDPAPRPHG